VRLRQLDSLDAIAAAAWDACFLEAGPFIRHAYLAALERHGCVGPQTGWTPCHALLEDAAGAPLAAAPLYLKTHSYGEFVFDFAWAEASRRLGRRYYPKLLCAVPFTPVSGARLGARDTASRAALAAALRALPERSGLSSLHALFLSDDDAAALGAAGCVERNDVQFHWRNAGYEDFAAFLATLTHDKRKKILRERRRIAEAGLQHRWESGDALSEAQWAEVYALYAHTYHERGQEPYLTLEFFLDYGRQPGTPVRLVSGFDGDQRVAVAITVQHGDTLYGRHWGAAAHYHSLHFETCYYQGIEYCIDQRLQHFDAGAQGGHKLARGFAPELTRSAHWLSEPVLADAVARALHRERALVREHGLALTAHSPYRRGDERQAAAEAPDAAAMWS